MVDSTCFLANFTRFIREKGTTKYAVANIYYEGTLHSAIAGNNASNFNRSMGRTTKKSLLFVVALTCDNMIDALSLWIVAGFFPFACSDEYDAAFCELYSLKDDGSLVWDSLAETNLILEKIGAHKIPERPKLK